MASSSAPEQDQEARAALNERALSFVDRQIEAREKAEEKLELADGLIRRLEREHAAMTEKVNARQMDSKDLVAQLNVEISRGVDLRRQVEETMKLIAGATGMQHIPLTSVAAAHRKLDEAVKAWRAAG